MLWLTLGLAFVVDVAAFNVFTGLASAAIWSVAETIVLLYIGMHGNRRAQIAGVLVGYAGFGASEMFARE